MKFFIKFFAYFTLLISLLIIIYIFYKSEIYYEGNNRSYYINYYIVCLILVIFSVINFYLNTKIREYLVIISLSFIFSLYLFESYLFLKSYKNKYIYEKQTSTKWDNRSKIEVYKDLKNTDSQTIYGLNPKAYFNPTSSILPLSTISNSKTVMCNENGYFSIYESDRYGFNNPDDEWDKQQVEYLVTGDSFAHGSCVNRPHDISSVLRILSNKSVLNLGFMGNGPLREYASLREYLNPKVKKVLWLYYENDLSDLWEELQKETLHKYLLDSEFSQNLKLRQNEINNLEIKKITIEKETTKIKIIKFIKLFRLRYLIKQQFTLKQVETSFPKLEKILMSAKALTISNNAKLYFVYLPGYSHYNSHRQKKLNDKNYNLVKEIVNKLNIPFIDIHKNVFHKEDNPLKLFPFEQPNHYNILGYKKVAEYIYDLTKD